MNRVLVTGMAIAKEVDVCNACGFNMDWLVKYPSILLWADKVLITKSIQEKVENQDFPSKNAKFGKTLKIVFDYLHSESMIEIIDPTTIITEEIKNIIFNEIEKDRNMLPKYFPDQIKLGNADKVPGQIFINQEEYCSPHLLSIYAAFLLSKSYKAESLFGDDVLNYVKYKFGAKALSLRGQPGKIESFHNIFQAYLPNIPVIPKYSFCKESLCDSCENSKSCKDNYLFDIEKGMAEMVSWRSYDEIQQVKSVIGKIVSTKEKAGEILNPDEISREFKDEKDKIQKRINKTFPKIKRWANISTILSIPAAIAGLSIGDTSLAITGASLAGLSQATKETIGYLSSTYNWLAFTNKSIEKKE